MRTESTCHENGEIRFLAGSHKQGPLAHITGTADAPSAPHLPTDVYQLEDTVPVPAKRGDVVIFSYYTIHGSYINQTKAPRRLVRVGYRNPHNDQITGVNVGKSGLIVAGYRERRGDEPLLSETDRNQ
ncbi:MAG: phytanoyl-CoA dioxygenase family protein [Chloroflexota bacterium]